MGEVHAANIQKISGAKVVGVVEVIKTRAQEFAQKYGIDSYDDYRPLIERKDLQAVVVCNPHTLHHDCVVAAANAGKHILCEKPIETTLEKIDSMLDACRKNKVLFMPGHIHRFLPANLLVKQLIDEGRIGQPIMAYDQILSLGFEPGYPAWMGIKSLSGGGMFINNGVHSVDRMRYWLNGEVTSVFSKCGRYALDIEVEDNGMMLLTLSNGTFANCHLSWSPPKPAGTCVVKIHGTEGIIECWSWKNSIQLVTKTDSDWRDISIPTGDGFLNEMREFISAIQENRPALVTPEDGRKAVSAILAAYESSNCGKAVIPK